MNHELEEVSGSGASVAPLIAETPLSDFLGTMRLVLFNVMLIASLSTLTACSPQPPTTTQNPPSYPSAYQVKVQSLTGGMDHEQVTTFVTNDKPEAIFEFYTNALLKDDWQLRDHLSTPSERHFGWVTPGPPNSTAYAATIYARPNQSGQTNVEIRLRTQYPK